MIFQFFVGTRFRLHIRTIVKDHTFFKYSNRVVFEIKRVAAGSSSSRSGIGRPTSVGPMPTAPTYKSSATYFWGGPTVSASTTTATGCTGVTRCWTTCSTLIWMAPMSKQSPALISNIPSRWSYLKVSYLQAFRCLFFLELIREVLQRTTHVWWTECEVSENICEEIVRISKQDCAVIWRKHERKLKISRVQKHAD